MGSSLLKTASPWLPAALTSCACCRRRGRGRVSLRFCIASALRCGARPWGAWGWTPRCAGSPLAACGGRWSTHSGGGGDREVKTLGFQNANTLFTHRLARAYGVGDYTCTTYASFGLSWKSKLSTVKCCHLEEMTGNCTRWPFSSLSNCPLDTKKGSCDEAISSSWETPVSELCSNVSVSQCEEMAMKTKSDLVSDCHALPPTNTHQGRVGRVSTTFGPN